MIISDINDTLYYKHNNILTYNHACDAGMMNSKLQCSEFHILPCFNHIISVLDVIDIEKITENFYIIKDPKIECRLKGLIVSGPYHIDDMYINNRKYYREYLCRTLNLSNPELPLVTIYEDEYCDKNQICQLANFLAKDCNIVLKAWSSKFNPKRYGVNEYVHVWNNIDIATNELKFGSDFMLTGFFSGSYASSAMLGLNVIPYYSKQTKDSQGNIISYKDQITAASYKKDKYVINKLQKANEYMFDLRDITGIKDAITSGKYTAYLQANYPRIQTECFGFYDKYHAPRATYNGIMDMLKYYGKI